MQYGKHSSNIKTFFFTTIIITKICWDSNAISRFHLIYIPQHKPLIFDEYYCNLHETKSSDKISQARLCGEQQKTNIDEVDVLLILLIGITSLLIVFVFLKTFTCCPYKFLTCFITNNLHKVRT